MVTDFGNERVRRSLLKNLKFFYVKSAECSTYSKADGVGSMKWHFKLD